MKFIHKAYGILCLIMFLFVFISCINQGNIHNEDINGKLKIISLSPSNTEILVGLSLGENIIGVDEYSGKVDGINKNAQIFKIGDPNIEAILELDPDIVFLSGYGVNISKFEKLKNLGIEVIDIETADSIDKIYESILFIGEKTSKLNEANEMVKNLKDEVEKVSSTVSNETVKIYFEISQKPYMYSFGENTFLNDLLVLLGGENIFKNFSEWISPNEEYIINANPQIIFTNVNVQGNIEEIKSRNGWENIDAVKNNRVYYIDKDYSSRPSQFFIKAVYEMDKHIKKVLNEE